MAIKLTTTSIQINPAGTWDTIAPADVLEATGSAEISGNRENALAFGDGSDLRYTIKVAGPAISSIPDRMPIRASFTVDGDSVQVLNGVVVKPSRNLRNRAWVLNCEGVKGLIGTTRPHSPAFYRRPVATKTTATSVEDPANPGYRAGLINYGLWQAGGRPYGQGYIGALFYYQLDQAILSPDWSWLAGENVWEACRTLARAAGGQLYQDGNGIVRYRQPLSFADSSAVFTFTPEFYNDIDEDSPSGQQMTKIICPYVPRAARALQEVINDTTARLVRGGETIEIVLEPQWPLKSVQTATGGTQLKDEAIGATYLDGAKVAQGGGGYTHTLDISAQRIVISLTNATSRPFVVNRVVINGEPITAGEPGSTSAGSGTIERTIEQNDFIQSRTHAQRLCDLTLAFYGIARPERTLKGCKADANRSIGEVVRLTVPAWSILDEPHLIVAIRHSKIGRTCDFVLISLAGLPKTSDYYRIGSTNYSGQTLKIGF